ncbi:MAG: hypothetical protein WCD12_20655 [Candidatus Binatus sp.]
MPNARETPHFERWEIYMIERSFSRVVFYLAVAARASRGYYRPGVVET